MSSDSDSVAVLIDGDNVEPRYFGRMLAWAARDKPVKIRRIYGSSEKLSAWTNCTTNHGIKHVNNPTAYENAADIMLAMDAAEILCSKLGVRDFCIVTHDNDFAGLVQWMHEKNVRVEVVWSSSPEKHKPSFRDMCDNFITVDELPHQDILEPEAREKLSEWKDMVVQAIKMHASNDGWALLSNVGNMMNLDMPGFKHADYCHKTLSSLIGSCPEFEIESDLVRLRCRES